MQPIAVINGTQIFSDKQVSSIVNSRVNFSDGSWCDVSTGEVVNRGAGYINIGVSGSISSATATIIKEPQCFDAEVVNTINLTANLNVEVYGGKQIEVILKGNEKDLRVIEVIQRGHTVFIEGKLAQFGGQNINIGGGNVIVRGVRGVSVNIVGSCMNITGGQTETLVTVKVPKKTGFLANHVLGDTIIGDTEGSLRVGVTSGNLKAGQVGDCQIEMSGSGDVDIAKVQGKLDVQLSGSGNVEVSEGVVSKLTVSLVGSGDVRFGGVAQDARLSLTGSGDIRVQGVVNRPMVTQVGSGRIRIGNW